MITFCSLWLKFPNRVATKYPRSPPKRPSDNHPPHPQPGLPRQALSVTNPWLFDRESMPRPRLSIAFRGVAGPGIFNSSERPPMGGAPSRPAQVWDCHPRADLRCRCPRPVRRRGASPAVSGRRVCRRGRPGGVRSCFLGGMLVTQAGRTQSCGLAWPMLPIPPHVRAPGARASRLAVAPARTTRWAGRVNIGVPVTG